MYRESASSNSMPAEVNHFDGMQDSEVGRTRMTFIVGSILRSYQASRASTALMKTDTTVKQLPAEHYDAFLTEKAKTRMPSASAFHVPPSPHLYHFLSQPD